jgi:hypothetical protein
MSKMRQVSASTLVQVHSLFTLLKRSINENIFTKTATNQLIY